MVILLSVRLTLYIIHSILIFGQWGRQKQVGTTKEEEKNMCKFTMTTLKGDQVVITDDDIICVFAEEHGTSLKCTDGRQYSSNMTLAAFEGFESTLFRCHRGRIVNLKRIISFDNSIELDEGWKVPVSRRRKRLLKAVLDNGGER